MDIPLNDLEFPISKKQNLATENEREVLYYEINDKPPWHLSALLGFQHYITMAGSTISTPVILSPLLCLAVDDPNQANLICSIMFISGIVTLLQSTFGTRLPIIQGGSFSFIVVSIAILGQPHFKCPAMDGLTDEAKEDVWKLRIREVQGAIIVASLFEVFIGLFGIVGKILKYITPMTVAPAITMIGLSLFKVSAKYSAGNWWIALLTVILIIIFSQYCKDVKIPIPFTRDPDFVNENRAIRYPVFQVFPVLLAIGISWILCFILTETNVLSAEDKGRTDVKSKIITNTLWFQFPTPFQWGLPTVSLGAVLGMLAGVIAGTVESIGDYYACARICGARPPPVHAINRGIFIEGIGCVLAGVFGTGTGTTSLSQNIGAIGISKVGSRRVIQAAGVIMIIFALIGKIGAVFVSIPEPIIGGVFLVVFATVAAVGLSNLQGVDLNSSRNIFVIGFSIFFGLTISQWMESNAHVIKTGSETIDQIITILLQTGMFVSFFLGFLFDNTIPGTLKERGLLQYSDHNVQVPSNNVEEEEQRDPSYELPFVMPFIERFKFFNMIPISPTYKRT